MSNMGNLFLPDVKFEAIAIKDLVTSQDYQRNLSLKHVRKAVSNFDIYQINPVKVSRRDGINYVFNGQHTMEIVAKISGSRDTKVWCMVYDDLGYVQEADIFANQQRFVKKLTPYEIFAANIEAGNDKQLLIKEIVESYNLQLGPLSEEGKICAVGALEFIYDRFGQEVLSRTLRLIIGAWEGDRQSLGANMLKGVARLLVAYESDIKDEIFIDKLGTVSVKEIIRSASDRSGGHLGYAEAILSAYNRKMHNPLPTQNLYDHRLLKKTSHSEGSQLEELETAADNPQGACAVQYQENEY